MPQTPKHATSIAPANGVILALDRIWHREGPLTAADLRDLNAISQAVSDMREALDMLSVICTEEVEDLENHGAQDPSKATRVVQARQALTRFDDLTLERIDPESIDVARLDDAVMMASPSLDASPAAPDESPGRLYVQWSNPFSDPVVGVLLVSDVELAQTRQRAASVRAAGMVEATFRQGDNVQAYFVEGYEDGDSSYAELFAATTGLPISLFERLEADYEENLEAQGCWIEGSDIRVVLQRLESIKSAGYAERASWGVAEVLAGDAIVVKATGAAFALCEQSGDDGRVYNFTVDFPLEPDVPTLDLNDVDVPSSPIP